VGLDVWAFNIMPYPEPGDRKSLPFRSWDREKGRLSYEAHLGYYELAEQLGFSTVGLAEHHFAPYATSPSPNVMAAAVAARTSTVKIALLGNALPLHGHPVRVAEELAMIDVLSNGRLVSGFIRGGFTEWFAYNIDPKTARERFEEAAELIVKAWTEPEPFAWHGKHFNYENISLVPKPVQLPHPPLLMAGSTAESIEWAAKRHIPLASSFAGVESMQETFDYYRKFAKESCGWEPGPEHFLVSRQVYVAPTNEQAREEAEEHIMRFFENEVPPAVKMPEPVEAYRGTAKTERSFAYKKSAGPGHQFLADTKETGGRRFTYEFVQREGLCIIGDPDYVATEIKRQQLALGIGKFLVYSPFSTLPMSLARKSLTLFAKEVLPGLR
jgi:alkanesulfonate monooxygenase SsuD/methylene tetrahydromethanopterin reductase-like flavin-dependent oxidoreductase (luciferase family)